MLYILRRTRPLRNGHPAYVARSGSKKSFTSSLKQARVFQSLPAAQSEACGDEYPVLMTIDGQLEMGI